MTTFAVCVVLIGFHGDGLGQVGVGSATDSVRGKPPSHPNISLSPRSLPAGVAGQIDSLYINHPRRRCNITLFSVSCVCVCVCVCVYVCVYVCVCVCVKLQALVYDILPSTLQALFYDILPSTTAVFSHAIGSRKLSANEQFFVGA